MQAARSVLQRERLRLKCFTPANPIMRSSLNHHPEQHLHPLLVLQGQLGSSPTGQLQLPLDYNPHFQFDGRKQQLRISILILQLQGSEETQQDLNIVLGFQRILLRSLRLPTVGYFIEREQLSLSRRFVQLLHLLLPLLR